MSIQRKYHDLHRIKVPTGDPNCLEDVWRAKRVKYAIGDRAEVGSGEETYNLEVGVFEVKGGLPVGAAGDSHIADTGGARRERGDREDMDADPIPPSSISSSGSNRQLSPM